MHKPQNDKNTQNMIPFTLSSETKLYNIESHCMW